MDDRAKQLATRADARRCLNAIHQPTIDAFNRADEDAMREYETATSALTHLISQISEDLDAADAVMAERRGKQSGTAGEAWRNVATGAPLAVIGREHAGNVAAKLNRVDGGEGTMGDFFRGVAGGRTTDGIKAALSVGTDGSGGYTVPSWLFPRFLEALLPVSSLTKAGARIVPLDDTAKTYRIARVSTVPSAAWRNEAGAVAESDPAFTAMDLTPRSLAFYFKVSRELLQDSANLDQMLPGVFAGALAKEIDRTGLRGSGTPPEPTGLLNTANVNAVTNGANGATLSTIKWANLISAYQAILDANGPVPTAAIMAPRSVAGFASLADSTGQPLQRPALLAPVEFIATSQIPVNLTVGSSTDCTELYVGDFSNMMIGMRESISVMANSQLYAATGQVGFFVHARVDFGVTYPVAFAKITGVRAA
jgi:HK97 family phage major capsid protein